MNLQPRIEELRAKKSRLLRSCEETVQNPTKTAVQRARWDDQLKEIDLINEELRRATDLASLLANVATEEQEDRARVETLNSKLRSEGTQQVFIDGAKRSAITQEIRSVLKGEVRSAMNAGTGNQGGYFVPQQFEKEMVLMQLASGPLFASSPLLTDIQTSSGNPRKLPATDDTANVGYVTGENSAATEADLVLGQVSMSATSFNSGIVLVSNELIQDIASFGSAEQVLQKSLAGRLSRIQNKTFLASLLTTLTANSSAAVAAGAGAIAADDVHNLIYSVNASYRASSKAAFLMNSTTAKSITSLKDTQGKFVYEMKRDEQGRVTLEGFPVYFSDYADNIATTKNPILFGDFSYLMMRHVPGIELQVLTTRYADQASTGVIARKRSDLQYGVLSTSDSAIKMLHFA